MEDLPTIDPNDIPDVHSEEFKQMAITNVLKMNEHLDNCMKMYAFMRAVPSVDQLTPDAWRKILEYGESMPIVLMFIRDTLKATGAFIDDEDAIEMVKNKVMEHHGKQG